MEASFYPEVLARRGIQVVVPSEDERRWIHAIYVGEFLHGEFHDGTRRELVAIVERVYQQEGIDGVILGGTELPLLLQQPEVAGLPTLDTTALHVAAIVERLRAGAAAHRRRANEHGTRAHAARRPDDTRDAELLALAIGRAR